MIPLIKSDLPKLAVSLVVTMFFLFTSQLTHAQNLGATTKEGAKTEVKTVKAVAPEKSEKTLHSTKNRQKESAVDSKKSLEKEKKEVESTKKSDVEEKLADIKKKREEIELSKQHGKLTEKEYQDAINKLDKMEKELKSESKTKLDSKGGR